MTDQIEDLDIGMYILGTPKLEIAVIGLHAPTGSAASDAAEMLMSAGAGLIDISELEQAPETSTEVRVKFAPKLVDLSMDLGDGKMWGARIEYEHGDSTVDPRIIATSKKNGGILVALLCGDRKLFEKRGYGFRPTGNILSVFAPIEFV